MPGAEPDSSSSCSSASTSSSVSASTRDDAPPRSATSPAAAISWPGRKIGRRRGSGRGARVGSSQPPVRPGGGTCWASCGPARAASCDSCTVESHARVDSAPWFWLTAPSSSPSQPPPVVGSRTGRPRSLSPSNHAAAQLDHVGPAAVAREVVRRARGLGQGRDLDRLLVERRWRDRPVGRALRRDHREVAPEHVCSSTSQPSRRSPSSRRGVVEMAVARSRASPPGGRRSRR